MSERTSGQLEREAEQIRAGIAQTAEALQDRMSPGKMIDEFMTYMKQSDGTLALDNLRTQARDNPMALAMIGSGVAWLIFGDGGGRRTSDYSAAGYAASDYSATDYRPSTFSPRDYQGSYAEPTESPRDYEGGYAEASEGSRANDDGGRLSGAAAAVGDAASGIAEKAGGLVDRAKDAAGQAADRVRNAAGDASYRARNLRHDTMNRGHAAADDVRHMAERGRRSVLDALDREPLVLGAIGVAVGAALGAMLPNTRFENETFGQTRDSLVREAERAVDRAAETARNVAGEAVEAAKSASKEEGLVIDGKAAAERVGDVAKAALSAGKDAAERELNTAQDAQPEQDAQASFTDEQPHRPLG